MNTISNFRMNQPINQSRNNNSINHSTSYTLNSHPAASNNVQFKGLSISLFRTPAKELQESSVKSLDVIFKSGKKEALGAGLSKNLKKLFSDYDGIPSTNVMNLDVIKGNYSKEGHKFLTSFAESFGVSKSSMAAGNDKDLLDMYNSTNKSNLKLRRMIVDAYSNRRDARTYQEGYNHEVADLKQLFDIIDNDKHAANYVKKTIKNEKNPYNIKDLNKLLVSIPTKQLDIFSDNVHNILGSNYDAKHIGILKKEIKNPFYMSPARKEWIMDQKEYGLPTYEDSIATKAIKYVVNKFNILRYGLSKGSKVQTPSKAGQEINKQEKQLLQNRIEEFLKGASEPNAAPVVSEQAAPTIVKPVVVEDAKPIEKPVETIIRTMTSEAPVEKIASPSKPTRVIKRNFITNRFVPKAPSAKKLEVINDVNGIIEKKLGSRVLADQKRDYEVRATKMRMQMLPEIFESIKETRAAERAAGNKLSVSNKDALGLYLKINGRNKKLVNYMLKKRNADGTRKFNIKEILATVEQAESKVYKDKYASPKTYKAADAKAYYNSLLEGKIQEYGQLEKSKRKK